ncbi:Afadin and alpha-actinin-binding-domain-containing protein, partial [Piptocephalis cylindrospora]
MDGTRSFLQDPYFRSSTPPQPIQPQRQYSKGRGEHTPSHMVLDTERTHLTGLSSLESPPGDSISLVAGSTARFPGFEEAMGQKTGYGEDEGDHPMMTTNTIMSDRENRQRDTEYREDLEERYVRVQAENETLQEAIDRYRSSVEQAERDADNYKGRWQVSESNYRGEAERHKATREELRAVKLHLQQGRSQYTHELRKRELEYGRLKDRLQKAMQDKYKAGKLGMKALNVIFGLWLIRRSPIIRMSLSRPGGKEEQLVGDNESLRRTIHLVIREMESLLLGSKGGDGLGMGEGGRVDEVSEEEVMMGTAAGVRGEGRAREGKGTHEEVAQLIRDIHTQYEHLMLQAQAPADAEILEMKEEALATREAEIDLLQRQSEEYKYVIEEQGKLIEMTLAPDFIQGKVAIGEGRGRKEGEDLTMEDEPVSPTSGPIQDAQIRLSKQRADLVEERKRFTDATIQIRREQEAFAREKAQFEEERRSVET